MCRLHGVRERAYPCGDGQCVGVRLPILGIVVNGQGAPNFAVKEGHADGTEGNRRQRDAGDGRQAVMQAHFVVACGADGVVERPIACRLSGEDRSFDGHLLLPLLVVHHAGAWGSLSGLMDLVPYWRPSFDE
jgi:hypothetical protein